MQLRDLRRYGTTNIFTDHPVQAQSVPAIPDNPLDFARQCLHFEPDPKHAEILSSGANSGMVNCSRQWGKSTLRAILTLHRALTRPDSLILYVGPTIRQSGELFDKAMHFLWQLGVKYRSDGRNTQSACLPNGSRIVAIPSAANRIRGFSAPNMIIIDEAAQVPDNVYITLRPMLLVNAGDL